MTTQEPTVKAPSSNKKYDYLYDVLRNVQFDLKFQQKLTNSRNPIPLTEEELEYFVNINLHVETAMELVKELKENAERVSEAQLPFVKLKNNHLLSKINIIPLVLLVAVVFTICFVIIKAS